MPSDTERWLADARTLGFDRLIYSLDALDGDIDPPIEAACWGVAAGFWTRYLETIRKDPLRRWVARGQIALGTTPLCFENYGASLSVGAGRSLSVGDADNLRWFHSLGHRTGVSFRIRVGKGRDASLNFFSSRQYDSNELDRAIRGLFLVGHQIHALIQPHLSRAPNGLLSLREIECLEWIACGKTNLEIAQLLGLSGDTVKEYVQSLFRKLDVSDRAQAVSRGHLLAYLG